MQPRRVKFGKPDTESEPHEQVLYGKEIPPTALAAMGGFALYRCHGEDTPNANILFSQKAYRDVMRHLKEDTTREHGGLLLGNVVGREPGAPTVIITHAVPARHTQGTPTSLAFTPATWQEWDNLKHQLKSLGIDLHRVGWYHSHPNISIFLSRYDLDVCTTFDKLRCPVALVVDPVQNRGGFFVKGPEGYRDHRPQGFWEFQCGAEPVVTWHNLHKVVFPPGNVTEAPIASEAAAAAASDEAARSRPPVQEERREARVSGVAYAAFAGLALPLVIIAGLLGSLLATVRRQEADLSGLQKAVATANARIAEIKAKVETLEAQATHRQPATGEPAAPPPAKPKPRAGTSPTPAPKGGGTSPPKQVATSPATSTPSPSPADATTPPKAAEPKPEPGEVKPPPDPEPKPDPARPGDSSAEQK